MTNQRLVNSQATCYSRLFRFLCCVVSFFFSIHLACFVYMKGDRVKDSQMTHFNVYDLWDNWDIYFRWNYGCIDIFDLLDLLSIDESQNMNFFYWLQKHKRHTHSFKSIKQNGFREHRSHLFLFRFIKCFQRQKSTNSEIIIKIGKTINRYE